VLGFKRDGTAFENDIKVLTMDWDIAWKEITKL
jgi:DNA-binding ferritin-like protein (Dps family)